MLIGRGGGLLFVALSMKLDSGAGLAAAAVPLRLALLGGIFHSVPSFLLHLLLLLPTACDATLQVNLSVGMHGLWSGKKTVQMQIFQDSHGARDPEVGSWRGELCSFEEVHGGPG